MNATRGRLLILATLLAAALSACTDAEQPEEEPAASPPADGYVIRGILRNALDETDISRETVYLHFFCDEIDFSKTLDPTEMATYVVRVPKATVRIRAYDTTKVYALYEKTITLEEREVYRVIHLDPTNYVRVHGKIIDRTSGALVRPDPDAGMGDTPLFYFHDSEGKPCHTLWITPESDGTYSVRLPRTRIEISVVDTPLGLRVRKLDLTGYEGAEYELNLELE